MYKPAIIVPYRNRKEHLSIFIPAMKKYLPDADIIVVEQADDKSFNRGKLLNIGYIEFPEYAWYVFHDVDKIPITVDYSYPMNPTQLEKSKIQKEGYFGGVTMFDATDFEICDGFSNNFWGWGGEDNELYNNIVRLGFSIDYRECVFKSLPHKPNGTFDIQKWKQSQRERSLYDSLTNCEYKVISKEQKDGYTLIKVEL